MTELIKDTYENIDLQATFEHPVECGKMLQIALLVTGEEACSRDILKILSEYQNFVHDSTVTTYKFVNASIQALERHKDSIGIVGMAESDVEETLPDFLEVLAGCLKTDIAMADEAGRAGERVAKVSKLGENAIFSAKRDLGSNTEKGKEIDDQINEINADNEAIKATQECYADAFKELGDEKGNAAMEAANTCDESVSVQVVGVIVGGVASGADTSGSNSTFLCRICWRR